MSPAAWRVRAEVSGLPTGNWERRLFMVLQAVFDESGNSPNQDTLVIGGLLASAEAWIRFTDQWDAALKRAPGAAFVKYTEITRGKGQFADDRGWNDSLRAERLSEFVKIIRDNAVCMMFASMRHADFERHVRSVPTAGYRSLLNDHPYALLAQQAAVPTIALLAKKGLTDKCDFYFDSLPGPDAVIQDIWPDIQAMPSTLPEGVLPFAPKIGGVIFRDGEDFLPLQAADLVAGMVRGSLMQEFPHPSLMGFADMECYPHSISEDRVRGWADSILRRQAAFTERHPNARVYSYDPATAKRLRKSFGNWLKPKR